MKKRLFILLHFLLLSGVVFSQSWDDFTDISDYTNFSNKQYKVINKSNLYAGMNRTKQIINIVNQGTNFCSNKFAYVQDMSEQPFDTFEYMIGYEDGWISTDDLVLVDSDVFPNSLKTDNKSRFEKIWIPVWYNSIIDINKKLEDYSDYFKRYKNSPEYSLDILHNIIFKDTFIIIGYDYYFSIKKIEKQNNVYYVDCEEDKSSTNYFNKYLEKESFQNLPDLRNTQNATFIIEQNGNRVRLYNGETKKLIIELMQVNQSWINDTIKYINSGYKNKPSSLKSVSEELEHPWSDPATGLYEDDKILDEGTSTNISVNKILTTNCNLKLRSGEATSTQVLTVMSAGTKVKILELGKTETIDGIKSNWVKVEIISGKDRDGKILKSGTTGWCYGGYLQ